MLKTIRTIKDLNFYQLMQVYSEGNTENARDFYPHLSETEGVFQAEQDFHSYLQVFFSQPGAVYAVWLADNRYVSALRLEPYKDGLLLSALETAPEYRGRGYATELLHDALSTLSSEDGIRVYSHVNKKNAASLAVHLACGFHRIAEYAVYADGSVAHNACTFCFFREIEIR